jgi:hypothetical protein
MVEAIHPRPFPYEHVVRINTEIKVIHSLPIASKPPISLRKRRQS